MKHLTFNKRLRNFVRTFLFKTIVIMALMLFTNKNLPIEVSFVKVYEDENVTIYHSLDVVKKQDELTRVYDDYHRKQKAIAAYIEWERTIR